MPDLLHKAGPRLPRATLIEPVGPRVPPPPESDEELDKSKKKKKESKNERKAGSMKPTKPAVEKKAKTGIFHKLFRRDSMTSPTLSNKDSRSKEDVSTTVSAASMTTTTVSISTIASSAESDRKAPSIIVTKKPWKPGDGPLVQLPAKLQIPRDPVAPKAAVSLPAPLPRSEDEYSEDDSPLVAPVTNKTAESLPHMATAPIPLMSTAPLPHRITMSKPGPSSGVEHRQPLSLSLPRSNPAPLDFRLPPPSPPESEVDSDEERPIFMSKVTTLARKTIVAESVSSRDAGSDICESELASESTTHPTVVARSRTSLPTAVADDSDEDASSDVPSTEVTNSPTSDEVHQPPSSAFVTGSMVTVAIVSKLAVRDPPSNEVAVVHTTPDVLADVPMVVTPKVRRRTKKEQDSEVVPVAPPRKPKVAEAPEAAENAVPIKKADIIPVPATRKSTKNVPQTVHAPLTEKAKQLRHVGPHTPPPAPADRVQNWVASVDDVGDPMAPGSPKSTFGASVLTSGSDRASSIGVRLPPPRLSGPPMTPYVGAMHTEPALLRQPSRHDFTPQGPMPPAMPQPMPPFSRMQTYPVSHPMMPQHVGYGGMPPPPFMQPTPMVPSMFPGQVQTMVSVGPKNDKFSKHGLMHRAQEQREQSRILRQQQLRMLKQQRPRSVAPPPNMYPQQHPGYMQQGMPQMGYGGISMAQQWQMTQQMQYGHLARHPTSDASGSNSGSGVPWHSSYAGSGPRAVEESDSSSDEGEHLPLHQLATKSRRR